MKTLFLPVLFAIFCTGSLCGQPYKDMMGDPAVNIYNAIDAAERHFEGKPKGKGSGWAGYQRWKYDAEIQFGPSGDRSGFDPLPKVEAAIRWIKDKEKMAENQRGAGIAPWTDMGPASANNVLNHYAPGLGRIDGVYVDPTDSNRIYLGARNGGFWYSLDHGATWTNTTDYLSGLGVNTIAVSPVSHDTVIVNMRVDPFVNIMGIYRSFDAGLSWTATGWNTGFSANSTIRKLMFNPLRPGEVYAVTSRGLYVSHDYFASWDTLFSANCRDMEFKPGNATTMYLTNNAQNDTMWTSIDGGQNWTGTPATGAHGNCELAVTPADSEVVYLCHGNGLYRSNNSAGSFSTVTTSMPDWFGCFGVLDTDANRVIYGGLNSFYSTDGGSTWNQIASWFQPSHPDYIHADLREVTTYQGHFYIGTDGYFAKSMNGGINWTRMSDGVRTREFYRIGVSPTHESLVIGGSQDNGTSYAWQGDWYEWLGADGMECAINRSNPFLIYGEWQYGGLHLSDDFGASRSNIKPSGVGDGSWITPFVLDQNHPCTIVAGYDVVHRTTDNGGTWTPIGTFPNDVDDIEMSVEHSEFMYVAQNARLWKTANGGGTWIEITGSLPNRNIVDIAMHPRDTAHVVLTYGTWTSGQQVYRSTNGGSTWTNITFDLPTIPAYDAVIQPNGTDRLYIGTRSGVFYLDPGATSWSSYTFNLPYVYTRELEVHAGTNMLRAGTYGRGLWEAPLIGKENSPKIHTIETSPFVTLSRPTEHSPVHIVCRISDDVSISSTWIEWSANNLGFGNTIAMAYMNADTYRTVTQIPAQSAGSTVHFKVYAVDNSGDTTVSDRIVYKTWAYNCPVGAVTANASASPTAICTGDSVSLNGSGGWELEWDQGLGFGASKTVSPTTTTTYTLTARDEDGCTDQDAVTVTVVPYPVVSLGNDTTLCGNTFSLDAGNPGASITYAWNTGGTSQTITASSSGTYGVVVTNAGLCAESDSIDLVLNPLPIVTLTLPGMDTVCTTDGPLNLSTGQPAGGTYSGPGVSGQTFAPATAGPGLHLLQYAYTDNNGCAGIDSASLFVEVCVGHAEAENSAFKLYPNPSGNPEFFVEAAVFPNRMELRVSDLQGRLVHEETIIGANTHERIKVRLPNGIAEGVYLLRLKDGENGALIYSGSWRYGK